MAGTYRYARCGDGFDSYDEAKYHVITNGFPVNPGSHIIGPGGRQRGGRDA